MFSPSVNILSRSFNIYSFMLSICFIFLFFSVDPWEPKGFDTGKRGFAGLTERNMYKCRDVLENS